VFLHARTDIADRKAFRRQTADLFFPGNAQPYRLGQSSARVCLSLPALIKAEIRCEAVIQQRQRPTQKRPNWSQLFPPYDLLAGFAGCAVRLLSRRRTSHQTARIESNP